MRRSMLLIGALAAGMVPASYAQTAAAAPTGPLRLAVVSFQDVVTGTNEFQRNFADLQKKYDPKRQELKALGDEIDTLTKQLDSQGASLGDAERANRAKVIDDKKKRAQRMADDAQNDFQQEMQQLFNATASKVGDVLIDYAKQQGYTLVLDGGEQQQGPFVLYTIPSTDISKAIVDAYNLKSGVSAPASLPAAPAPNPAAKPPGVR
ncbi:MAG TPA: OmpH family outer membrane protein [Terracidiphilus sp.]